MSDLDMAKLDLLGHTINPHYLEHVGKELLRKREFSQKREAERLAEGKKPMHDGPEGMWLTYTVECSLCGRNSSVFWTGRGGDTPRLWMQFRRTEEQEVGQPRELPDDTRCPVPEILPIPVRFTCKSGRIAVGNDFRQHFPALENHGLSINSHAGKRDYVKLFASHGYITGYVGNARAWFVSADGGLDVLFPGAGDDRVTEEEFDRLDGDCAHYISAELRWVAVVDAADLPDGATDSYDREAGFMDLPPGEYEVVVESADSTEPVVITFRRLIEEK